MCGRAVQTKRAIDLAETMLLSSPSTTGGAHHPAADQQKHDTTDSSCQREQQRQLPATNCYKKLPKDYDQNQNNLNLSPGQSSIIFCSSSLATSAANNEEDAKTPTTPAANDHDVSSSPPSNRKIDKQTKVWGIIPKSGTKNHPLPEGPGKHFSSLMYNARSETLCEKKTFGDLMRRGNTCIWAIDGFYEWKTQTKTNNALSKENSSGKQPYFVCRRDGKPLLIPGLWKSVKTGRKEQQRRGQIDGYEEDEYLDTFTHLTADACPALQWLHHRQPAFLWDNQLAIEWMRNPSKDLVAKISFLASSRGKSVSDNCNNRNSRISAMSKEKEKGELVWYPVTKKMSNVKYRQFDCWEPIKIETVPSVKSFFKVGSSTNNSESCRSNTTGRKAIVVTKTEEDRDESRKNRSIQRAMSESLVSASNTKSSKKTAKKSIADLLVAGNTNSKKRKINGTDSDKKKDNVRKKGVITQFFISNK